MEFTLEGLAEYVLIEHSVNFPPIDIFEIIRREDFKLFIKEMPITSQRISGICFELEDRINIIINNDSIPEHQRFTAAHELKHALVEPGEDHVSFMGKELDRIEREANSFAAELLMPVKFIDLLEKSFGFIDQHLVARVFGVSLPAAIYRLEYLGRVSTDYRKYLMGLSIRKRDAVDRHFIRDMSLKGSKGIPTDLSDWIVLHELFNSALIGTYRPRRCSKCSFPMIYNDRNRCWRCNTEVGPDLRDVL